MACDKLPNPLGSFTNFIHLNLHLLIGVLYIEETITNLYQLQIKTLV